MSFFCLFVCFVFFSEIFEGDVTTFWLTVTHKVEDDNNLKHKWHFVPSHLTGPFSILTINSPVGWQFSFAALLEN